RTRGGRISNGDVYRCSGKRGARTGEPERRRQPGARPVQRPQAADGQGRASRHPGGHLMRRTLAFAAFFCLTVAAVGQEAPRTLLEKAIIAQGGERLAKARLIVRSAKGELDAFPKPIAFVGEAQFNLPEQARWSFELEQDKQKALIVLVLNK